MNNIEGSKSEEGQQETTGWDNLGLKPGENWGEHIRNVDRLIEQESSPVNRKVNLAKPKILERDKDGNMVERTSVMGKTFFSRFDRYPEQQMEIAGAMRESLEKGKPLSVVNIGVAQGQEALGYIQMASDMVGEESISDALDLELVEYADQIPIASLDNIEGRRGNINESSVNYLKGLFDTPKAHFGTPFQEYAKSLKEKGGKRDVILFNNVIQHLDYDNTSKEQMREDMANLADIVADGGMICMTTNQYMSPKHPEVKELFDDAVKIWEEKGLTGEVKNIGGAWTDIGQQAIFRKL